MTAKTNTRSFASRVVLLLAATSLAAACGSVESDDLAELRKRRAAAKADTKAKAASADAVKPVTEEDLAFTYNAVDRRDPFKTYFDELLIEEQEQRSRTELQRFELDKLSLIAVVVGTATPMAMVQDPSGRGHTVKIGTLIGKRFGQVKAIRRGEIVVQEEFRDFTGKRIPVLKTLKLEVEEPQKIGGR
jgi:type IV pilus assembly protein PilP